jgi:hypothetical protein
MRKLTGKQVPRAQLRWLKDHGYRHDVNGLGLPIVATAEVFRKLVGTGKQVQSTEPNWDAMYGQAAQERQDPAAAAVPAIRVVLLREPDHRQVGQLRKGNYEDTILSAIDAATGASRWSVIIDPSIQGAVAQQTGTSVGIIAKHYAKFIPAAMRKQLEVTG